MTNPRPVRDDRDGGAADPQVVGGLGAAELVDDDEARNLALARRQVREQCGQERPEVGEALVRLGIAGDGDQAVAVRAGPRDRFAGDEERAAGPFDGGSGARIDLARDQRPAQRARVGVQGREEDRAERVGVRRQQALAARRPA